MSKLAILIPSMPQRMPRLRNLLWELERQIKYSVQDAANQVEILTFMDRGKTSIGWKRNKLLALAEGHEYITFIDDDDQVGATYLDDILHVIYDEAPDVISFNQQRHGPGPEQVLNTTYTLASNPYGHMAPGGVWVGFPPHTAVWQKDLVVEFPLLDDKEDMEWMKEMHGRANTHVHIPKVLYFYQFRIKPYEVEYNEWLSGSSFPTTV